MKIKTLFLLTLVFTSCIAEPEFVVEAPKKETASKNLLKEQIGEKIKVVMDECASIVERIGSIITFNINKDSDAFDEVMEINTATGEMLQIVGKMQRRFAEKAQQLLENRRPFKKASKNQLRDTVNVTESVYTDLRDQLKFLKMLDEQLSGELKNAQRAKDNKKVFHLIKHVNSDLKAHLEPFRKAQSKVLLCSCLK